MRKNSNIVISHMSYYHPESKIGNDYFIEHFKKQNKDITGLLKSTGREHRYHSDYENENTLDMSVKAANKMIEDNKINPLEIDMIVFMSSTPEYLVPANAIVVSEQIGAKNAHMAFDMIVSCTTMVRALELVSRYMYSSPDVKKALILGAEQIPKISKLSDEIVYPLFGDASFAFVLDKIESEDKSGFIDGVNKTNSSRRESMVYPECGFSNVKKEHIPEDKKKLLWEVKDPEESARDFSCCKDMVDILLERNNLTKQDISHYCMSQFSKDNLYKACELLEEDKAKFSYIGDKYGYTGFTSPFLTLFHAVESGEIKRGDYVILWTIGAGVSSSAVLIKY